VSGSFKFSGGDDVLVLLPDEKTWVEHTVAYSCIVDGRIRCVMTDGCDVSIDQCAPIKQPSENRGSNQ